MFFALYIDYVFSFETCYDTMRLEWDWILHGVELVIFIKILLGDRIFFSLHN